MSHRGIGVVSVLLSLIVVSIAADTPTQMTYDAGFDARGQRWSFIGRTGTTILVKGPRTFDVAGTGTLQYLSLMGVIDPQDRLWIVDAAGEGVSIDLAAGAGRRFKIAVTRNLERGLQAHDGSLYFVERVRVSRPTKTVDDSFALTRYDTASGRKAALYVPADVVGFSHRFAIAGRLGWFVNAVRDARTGRACEVVGVDLGTGAAVVTDRRPARPDRGDIGDVAGAPDGAVWLSGGNRTSVSVYRRDRSGNWREWLLDAAPARSIDSSGLTFSSGHALVLLRHFLRATDEPHRMPPVPSSPQAPIAMQLAAIGGETGQVRHLPVPVSNATLRLDQTGAAWYGDRRLVLTGDRFDLASANGEKRSRAQHDVK